MAGISIRLSSLDDYKAINVEGLGVIKVKKESSNQGLQVSEDTRDIFRLQDEAKKLDKKIKLLINNGANEDDLEIQKIESKAAEKLDKITEIRKSIQNTRKLRLSDNEGGKLVEKLFDSATDADISKLFALADGLEDEENVEVVS